MAAGRRDLERAAREQLAAHVSQIGRRPRSRRWWRHRHERAAAGRIVQRLDGAGERIDRNDVQPRDDRRLAGVRRGQKNSGDAVAPGRRRNRQDPPGRVDRSVERELAEQHEIDDVPAFDDALRGENAERDRQIEGRTRFAHVGGREVHRDAMRGKLEPGIADGASHAVAALTHARIGQADHGEARKPERHVDFDVDRTGFDAENGGGPQAGEHGRDAASAVSRLVSSVFNELAEWLWPSAAVSAIRR